ncbi:MAG: Xaa-Pro peptidase family protein [Spirochaetes bacterium]|nr:Xaa-Pro peptidase family protein [Spirochaetota bacterium]MBU1081798.1 Xaa-Pro peptidase family protein [Spirochaetota bacterium]
MTRRVALAKTLADSGVAIALFEDTEGRRDPSIRYFSGHPGDALLFISADGRSLLVPWDMNMAASMARVEDVVAYTDFNRSPFAAMAGALARLGIAAGSVVDLPSVTPYPMYVDYVEACPDYDFRCTDAGSTKAAAAMRAVKDADEIAIYRAVSAITDAAMDDIEAGVRSGRFETETDLALFIERFLRESGCESTGFETLAAGPSRSFGIHAFPAYTAAAFGTEGMSILDFGLSYKGYTSDVTMTFVKGDASGKRAEMIALVKKAHKDAIAACGPGVKSRDVALLVDAIFSEKGYAMPHGLGHGVGLEAHEAPAVRSRADNDWVLAPGHVITIEPGLYDPEAGGVRLEDDVLITEDGYEVLTHSRIVELG